MSAKGKFLCTLAVVNAFFMGFAYGFNARPVLVVDTSLPPLAPTLPVKANSDLEKKTSREQPVPGKVSQKSPAKAKNIKSSKHKEHGPGSSKNHKSTSADKSGGKGSKSKAAKSK